MTPPRQGPPEPLLAPEPARPVRRDVPAEVQYLLIVLALCGVLLVSGVPGAEVPEAGNGTGVLRRDWAERWSAQVAGGQAHAPGPTAPAAQPAEADAPALPPR